MIYEDSAEAASGTPRIFTVGHSNKPVELLIAKLEAFQIRVLVDVRRHPSSKRYPQYNRPALAVSLQLRGMAYIHEIDLGGHREPMPGSPNGGLRNPGLRGYADHMATEDFRLAFERIKSAAKKVPLALMCAEADPVDCHRLLLSDALTLDGFEVVHVLKSDETRIHQLSPEARVEDGVLTYPPDRNSDTELS